MAHDEHERRSDDGAIRNVPSVPTRVCRKCGSTKKLSDFPTYVVRGKRGHRHTCRTCWNEKWSPVIQQHGARYYHENHAGVRDRVKARTTARHRTKTTEEKRRMFLRYEARHPERAAAKRDVMLAVRSGRLKKRGCFVCGSEPAQAHHDDYSKPLSVIWLCRFHHGERHRLLHRHGAASDWPPSVCAEWPEQHQAQPVEPTVTP